MKKKHVDNPIKMNLQLFNDGPAQASTGTDPVPSASSPAPAAAPQGTNPALQQQTPSAPAQPAQQTPPVNDPPKFNSLAEYLQAKGHMPGANPQPATPAQPSGAQQTGPTTNQTPPAGQTPAPNQPSQPTTDPAQQPGQSPSADPNTQPQAPILGKFKSLDDLTRSYTELEKWNHQLAQRHGLPPDAQTQRNIVHLANQQAQQIAQLEQQLQQYQGGQITAQPGAQQPTQQQAMENSLGMSAEEFSDLLVTNPEQAMKKIQEQADRAAQLRIEAWENQQRQTQEQHRQQVENWQNQLAYANAVHADFQDMMPQVIQYIEANPAMETLPNAIELAYKAVKADILAQQTAAQKSPDELLKDENFRQQVLKDEGIRQAFLKSHVEAVKSGQPPTVITNQPGLPPAAAPEEIRSTEDAKKASIGFFNRMLGRVNQ